MPAGLMWCDIEYEEIKHCDESETFVELGKRKQDPRDVIEPDGKQTEGGGYRSEDDDSDQPVVRTKSAHIARRSRRWAYCFCSFGLTQLDRCTLANDTENTRHRVVATTEMMNMIC